MCKTWGRASNSSLLSFAPSRSGGQMGNLCRPTGQKQIAQATRCFHNQVFKFRPMIPINLPDNCPFVQFEKPLSRINIYGGTTALIPYMYGVSVWRSDVSFSARSRHTTKCGGKYALSPYIWVEQMFPRKGRACQSLLQKDSFTAKAQRTQRLHL